MNENKICLLLINKADYLSEKARKIWAKYFESKNINFVYFSAKMSQERIDHEDEVEQMRLAKEDRDKAQSEPFGVGAKPCKSKNWS